MIKWQRIALPFFTSCLLAFGCGNPPGGECVNDIDCNDAEPCTSDVCDRGLCVNNADDTLVPQQGAPFDCKREVCQDGRTIQVPDDTEIPNDNVACTQDVCLNGVPAFEAQAALCGDASACNAFICDPNGVEGTPDANGCVAVADDTNLPDDNSSCTADACQNGTPVFTPDDTVCLGVGGFDVSCVAEVCDPENQTTNDGTGCAVLFEDLVCDDGNFCTDNVCDPNDAGADPLTGCIEIDNNGVPTQIVGNCQEEVCQNGNPEQVPDPNDVPVDDTDGIDCTVPGCDNAGNIVETPDNGLCDDALGCTDDICVGGFGCEVLPNDALCGPGEACDSAEDPVLNPTGCVLADVCPPVLLANVGGTVSGDTSGFLDDFSLSCTDNGAGHPDLAFALDLAVDSDVTLSVQSTDGHEVAVALVPIENGVCGSTELICDADIGLDAEINVVNLAAGQYAIVVDGNGPGIEEGTFDLTVFTLDSSITVGDLVINEFQPNPVAVGDGDGEFLEIANPGTIAIATAGLTLSENAGAATQAIEALAGGQLIIEAGGFIVGTPNSDPLANGGIDADFDLAITLNNTPNEVFQVAKAALVIDEVDTVLGSFPGSGAGISFQLDPVNKAADLNDDFTAWCLTPTAVYGVDNDRGTPGAENESCVVIGECVIPEDCDDANPCTDDICEIDSICNNPPNDALDPGDDGFSCTIEICLGGNIDVTFDDASCDDGVGCTVDACIGTGGAAGTGCSSIPDNGLCGAGEICDPVQDCIPDPGGQNNTLVINEIDYDQVGGDTASFLEILNVGAADVNLSDFAVVLVNGNGEVQYDRFDLIAAGAVLAPGQYLVIANDTVTVDPAALVISDNGDFMQNGPDAIAIFQISNNQLIDAFSYEGDITNAATDFGAGFNMVEGTLSAFSDNNQNEGSLIRSPDGQDTNDASVDWIFTDILTPGAPNP